MLRFLPLTFSKADLANVPEDHRIAYIALGQIATECSILKRLAISGINALAPPQPRMDAATATALFATRMLGRLVWESRATLNSREVAASFETLSGSAPAREPTTTEFVESAQVARRAFNQILNRSVALERFRNEMGAHVDLRLIKDSFERIPDNTTLIDHLAEESGNMVYGAADTMRTAALAAIYQREPDAALRQSTKEVTDAATALTKFIDAFILLFVVTHFGRERATGEMIVVEGAPSIDEMQAPLFFEPAA